MIDMIAYLNNAREDCWEGMAYEMQYDGCSIAIIRG